MGQKRSHAVLVLYDQMQRNLREDRAFLSECKDVEKLEFLEEYMQLVIAALDDIKGFVRVRR